MMTFIYVLDNYKEFVLTLKKYLYFCNSLHTILDFLLSGITIDVLSKRYEE